MVSFVLVRFGFFLSLFIEISTLFSAPFPICHSSSITRTGWQRLTFTGTTIVHGPSSASVLRFLNLVLTTFWNNVYYLYNICIIPCVVVLRGLSDL